MRLPGLSRLFRIPDSFGFKLGSLNWLGRPRAHRYPNRFVREPISDGGRITFAPSTDHAGWIRKLIAAWPKEAAYVLYVLTVPRKGNREAGRYESPEFSGPQEVLEFLEEFEDFFAGDGRHHIWFTSPNFGQIVWDNHDILFIYGSLDRVEEILRAGGATEGSFRVPTPHIHAYNEKYDEAEERLMASRDWKHYPLQPTDDPWLEAESSS